MAVIVPIDLQGLTKSCGTAGPAFRLQYVASRGHGLHSPQRLAGADQDGAAASLAFGDRIHAVFGVNGIHVQMSGGAEHGAVPWPHASTRVAGRIFSGKIGFRFDDDSTGYYATHLRYQHFPQKLLCYNCGVAVVKCPWQRVRGNKDWHTHSYERARF